MEVIFGQAVIPFGELLWRFGVASAFGLVLGLDREFRGISAGVRTHMLVALSSAMTMLIALRCRGAFSPRPRQSRPDPRNPRIGSSHWLLMRRGDLRCPR